MAVVKVDERKENKRKRMLGDLTVDLQPRPHKRTKLVAMNESESKVGKIDEETVCIIIYPLTFGISILIWINIGNYTYIELTITNNIVNRTY